MYGDSGTAGPLTRIITIHCAVLVANDLLVEGGAMMQVYEVLATVGSTFDRPRAGEGGIPSEAEPLPFQNLFQ